MTGSTVNETHARQDVIEAEFRAVDPVKSASGAKGYANAPKCGATLSNGRTCRSVAWKNGRCKRHGGNALSGPAHPRWTGKNYSDLLPVSMRDAYVKAKENPDILALTDEIALVQVRLEELLGKVTTGESAQRWKATRDAWKMLRRAQRMQDPITIAEAMEELDSLMGDSNREYLVWEDLYRTITKLQSLIGQEQKRRLDAHNLLSADHVVGFATELLLVVKEYVDDPRVLNRIYREMTERMEKQPAMKKAITQSS